MLTSKERSALRSIAANIEPITQVGKFGVNESLIESLDKAIEKRELIKVTVLENSMLNPKETGFEIAEKDLEMRGGGDFFGTRQSGKMLTDIKNLKYPTQVIFAAKRLVDDAFDGNYADERLRKAAIKKYDSLKDVVLN